jgi:nicotinamidase-related amidase
MDAMLVVHMQVGLLNGMPKHDLHGVVDRINRLAARVRAQTGKVILIQHCGGKGDDFEPQTPGWQFLPELVREAADIIVPTTLNDPFAGTDLQARLKELQPDRVLIAGWATDF